MTKGIHRSTPDSKAGRSMISPGMEHRPWAIPADIRKHNEQVEAKRFAKKLAKAEKKLQSIANNT